MMTTTIIDHERTGSGTRYFGKTALTMAVFASVALAPLDVHHISYDRPLTEHATPDGSQTSFKIIAAADLIEENILAKLVSYLLEEDDPVPYEFASISRNKFFDIYEPF